MTRSRWSPLRLIEEWEALYWHRNSGSWADDEPIVVPRRTVIAWWCQHRIETATAIWQVLTAPEDRQAEDLRTRAAHERAFYRMKATLCLLAGRDGGDLDDNVGYARMTEAMKLVVYNLEEYETMDGPGGACDEVHVGIGVLKHWYAYVEQENWP
jgi:hypothetical protein